MAETYRQIGEQLTAAYQELSPFEQSLLQLLSIIYEPVNRAAISNCLRRASLGDPTDSDVNLLALTPHLQKLQETGFLNEQYRCHEAIVEVFSRAAVASGVYRKMAAAVQEKLPFVSHYTNRSTKCWRLRRELRIALYTLDIAYIEQLQSLLTGQCADLIDSNFPVVQICTNPFSDEWFRPLPASLQFYLLNQIHGYSLRHLQHQQDSFAYLANPASLDHLPVDERLPFHRLHANYLLWRGSLDDLRDLVRQHPESFAASGFEGCLSFLTGENKRAIDHFEADLQLLRKITGNDKTFFLNICGLFYILAIFKTGYTFRLAEIREFIHLARQQQTDTTLLTAYHFLEAVMLAQENMVVEADAILRETKPQDHGLTMLYAALTHCWLYDELPNWIKTELIDLFEKARANGFRWLAMEYGEILGRFAGHQAGHEYAAAVQHDTGMTSLLTAVSLEDSWERSLKALLNATAAMDTHAPPPLDRQSRLVWLIGYTHSKITISPKEQRYTAKTGWSDGRPVALSRLYGDRLDFLTEQDRAICGGLRRESSYHRMAYHFEMDKVLPAMIGHPLLFLEEAPSVVVEFVKGEPELLVEKCHNRLLIKLSKDITDERVTVIRETPTRFKIIQVTEDHRRIARILGRHGLQVPKSASSQVITAISNISSVMTVHSAIAADQDGRQPSAMIQVDAESRIFLHLLPFGTGFRLEMFVRPFTDGGPYLKPGQGVENVMVEVRGRRLLARRNLALELANSRLVIDGCPTLALLEEIDQEWHLEEVEDCLQVLLELQELGDKVTVEWPEGEQLSVKRRASLEQLHLRIRKKQNWFEVSGGLAHDDALILDMKKLLSLVRKTPNRFIPLGEGQFLTLTQELRRRIEELSLFYDEADAHAPADGFRLHSTAVLALEDFSDGISHLDADTQWQEHISKIRAVRELQPQIPSTLQAELRGYQTVGYTWLARLAQWGTGGCLADDMGLGKTLQALAIILARAQDGPTLIVAPTSVCANWQTEADRFAPTINVISFGAKGRKKLLHSLRPFDMLVTSYTMLQQEEKMLAQVEWQTIVLDEAQAIKNIATKRSRAAMALNGRFKLITTGTPIENHLGELWNLFNFVTPGLLGSLTWFNQHFGIPIERFQDHEAKRKLKKLLQPFILRRLKSQVLEELPPRTEIILQVEMNPEEAAFYEALRQQALENLARLADRPGGRNMHILAEIMRLRRACCNPRLVVADSQIPSSKLELFGTMVEELLENRHKVLVFSQFVGHLTILREFLEQKQIDYRYLDGSTPARERGKEVDKFQAGQGDVFLISLKAGGLGINLTAADYVIHMDPWWNPAVEDQASDRAHRIGQKHPVTIYRLMTRGSIEEKIVKLHQQKRELANSLLDGTDISGRMSAEELLNLIKDRCSVSDEQPAD